MVVSEREYKDSHALRPFSKDLGEISTRVTQYGIPHRLPLDHSLMVGQAVVQITDKQINKIEITRLGDFREIFTSTSSR